MAVYSDLCCETSWPNSSDRSKTNCNGTGRPSCRVWLWLQRFSRRMSTGCRDSVDQSRLSDQLNAPLFISRRPQLHPHKWTDTTARFGVWPAMAQGTSDLHRPDSRKHTHKHTHIHSGMVEAPSSIDLRLAGIYWIFRHGNQPRHVGPFHL
ncbi:unnamed protein product [Protopolystoma xenopodis]|uniref:Uncharacterized protein n=1 Tax=Protopolystoma xenopodis TaxID=117903 RepID=A0A448XM13_9PLAT|nr:unnamed protein product [Protopolystoma xenopodis]